MKGVKGFQKGCIPYNKGGTSWNKGLKGVNVAWNKDLKGLQSWHNISQIAVKGKHNSPNTEIKKGQRISPYTEFTKENSGENHYNWKGGKYDYQVKNAPRPKPDICELCHKEGRICYDHDHATGKFRGWLCIKCNSALGMVDDNPELLSEMIKYINNSK